MDQKSNQLTLGPQFNYQPYPNFKQLYHCQVKNYSFPIENPYKQVSPMETNWILKSVVSFGAGGVMGLVMGLFMNAMESGRQFDVPGVKQPSTKMLLRKDARRILGQARGFALFGFFFSAFETNICQMRGRDDQWNDFWGCGLTSIILAIGTVQSIKGYLSTFAIGGLFGGAMYHVNLFG